MYMVDKDKAVNSEFGFTNQDGDIESVNYIKDEEIVEISHYHRIYPQDVANMIKALQHMQKYLIDEGIIK